MGPGKKRELLKTLYGPQWAAKVDRMSDQQVIAVYFRFKKEGKIR